MDVGALRQVVEEVAQKKTDIGPIDIGINRRVLYATTPLDKLEMPSSLHSKFLDCIKPVEVTCSLRSYQHEDCL
ncbi:unnamed protein product [Anisakis simplex]|nr:unnamed protein product [Anisakis simplex]